MRFLSAIAVRLLPVLGLLGGQLALAAPAHASAGALDPSFGTGGKVKMDFTGAGGDDVIRALAVQANDRLVAAGHARDQWALARFRTNGTLDPSFGADGKV